MKVSQSRDSALESEIIPLLPPVRGAAASRQLNGYHSSDDNDDDAGDDDKGAGTVDFMTASKPMTAARKRKRQDAKDAKRAKAKEVEGKRGGGDSEAGEGGDASALKKAKSSAVGVVPGALAQAGSTRSVPMASRANIFGVASTTDASTFRGLGLSEVIHLSS